MVNFCRVGWPLSKNKIPENLKLYHKFRHEIYIDGHLLFFGDRLIVPNSIRNHILNVIHKTHQGVVKSK